MIARAVSPPVVSCNEVSGTDSGAMAAAGESSRPEARSVLLFALGTFTGPASR